ncbi:MAG: hypothetical protein IH991_13965 [Planctomycetes bacterium]|nr:hypothetical protein [Planctomycetota bacterium]
MKRVLTLVACGLFLVGSAVSAQEEAPAQKGAAQAPAQKSAAQAPAQKGAAQKADQKGAAQKPTQKAAQKGKKKCRGLFGRK